MGIRRSDNLGKYTAQELKEYRQSESDMNTLWDDMQAKNEEKKAIILKGLVRKYGFSVEGAKATVAIIVKDANIMTGIHPIENAKFANEEMKKAAMAAFEYYQKL